MIAYIALFSALLTRLSALACGATMMSWYLMPTDVSWHIRDKLWPMPKHGSIILYVHETRRLVRTDSPGRPPRLSHSSWTMSVLRSFCFCSMSSDDNSGATWVTSFLQRVFEYPPKWCTCNAGMAGATWNCFLSSLFFLFLYCFHISFCLVVVCFCLIFYIYIYKLTLFVCCSFSCVLVFSVYFSLGGLFLNGSKQYLYGSFRNCVTWLIKMEEVDRIIIHALRSIGW